MLQIPEAAQWLPQNTPALLEARGPMMLPETARELGLNETQVVEALVRVRGERMELFLNGRSIEVPPGWRMSPGQTVWLTAHSTTQGLWVLRQHASAAIAQRAMQAAAAKASMQASTAASPARPAAESALAAAVAKPDPAQEAAAARVERAKVVLQARAQGEDPLRVLAKRAQAGEPLGTQPGARQVRADGRADARVDAQMAGRGEWRGEARAAPPGTLPTGTPAPSLLNARMDLRTDLRASPDGLLPGKFSADAGSKSAQASSASPLPLGGKAPALNTSLAPYWRAAQAEGLQTSARSATTGASAAALAGSSAAQGGAASPVKMTATAWVLPSGPSLAAEAEALPNSPAAPQIAHASVPPKWAGLWSQAAAPDFIDWQQASPRMRALAAHPPGMQAVMQLFQPQVLALLAQTPGLASWAQMVMRDRLSMRNPDANSIQGWVERLLSPSEAQLAKGHVPPPHHDMRSLLSELLRGLRAQGDAQAATAHAALSDVESAQVDHLRALHQREWTFQCVLPFADAPSAQLHLQREAQDADGADGAPPGAWAHKWWVSLYTESEGLGRVWMRSGVSVDSSVEMQVWATRDHVVEDARARVEDLRDLLSEAGLTLSGFVVTHGERPAGPSRVPPPHGAVLDQQA